MSDEPSNMTDRLESLKASIRASKPRVPKVEEPEVGDATLVRNISDFASVQGTPLYMSPEECESNPLSPQTDVYSLGIMMFEMLEGHAPYMAGTMNEVLLMHLDAPIPEQKSVFTPPEIKELVRRMLAKSPEDRPDMAEVIEVLQQHVGANANSSVMGLEEESWTVSEIEESVPVEDELPPASTTGEIPTADDPAPEAAFFNSPLANRGIDATWDVLEAVDEDEEKRPVWIIGVVVLLLCFVAAAWALGGDDEPEDHSPVEEAAAPVPEAPEPVEPVFEEVIAPVVEPAVADAPDAGAPVDTGVEAVETPEEEPVVEEAPKPEPKPKPKPKRKRRAKPKPKLQELRL